MVDLKDAEALAVLLGRILQQGGAK
jgi:hypothetical protein